MLRQLLVGGGVSVVNIAIHALVMTILGLLITISHFFTSDLFGFELVWQVLHG
jgi:hypothetical protein